jgi:hypothetical protein
MRRTFLTLAAGLLVLAGWAGIAATAEARPVVVTPCPPAVTYHARVYRPVTPCAPVRHGGHVHYRHHHAHYRHCR